MVQSTQKPRIIQHPAKTNNTETGEIVLLEVKATGKKPLKYQWKKNDEIIYGATQPILAINIIEEEDEGIYYCEVSNEFGTVVSKYATIELLVWLEEEEEEPPEVSGNIIDENGAPIQNATVIAYDKSFGDEKELSTTTTDEDGNFQMSYNVLDLSNDCENEKETANLVVKVFVGQELIVESPVYIESSKNQKVNLHTGTIETYRKQSRFSRVKKRLKKHFDEVSDLTQITAKDIYTLVECAKTPFSDVISYFNAETIGDLISYDKEVLYGLYIQLNVSFLSFINMDRKSLASAIKSAADNDLIDPSKGNDPENEVNNLIDSAATYMETNLQFSSTGEIFDIAGLEGSERLTALKNMIGNQHLPADTIWNNMIAEDIDTEKINKLKKLNALYNATGQNYDLTEHIYDNMLDVSEPKDLTKYSRDDWESIISVNNIEIPDYVSGDTQQEKISNYAKNIDNRVEDTYPGLHFFERYIQDIEMESTDIEMFVGNNPEFELPNDNINVYLNENSNALDNIDDPVAFEEQLKAIQRLYKICPKNDKYRCFKILWLGDIRSSRDIIAKGKSVFVDEFGDSLGTNPVVLRVWNNASFINNTSLKIYSDFSVSANLTSTSVIKPNKLEEVDLEELPDFSELFGHSSFCSCKHCRSTLSPAAYLVDLLNFLKSIITQNGGQNETLLDRLFIRRPDIGEILLSCDNTNTSFPYIDLVNEILENALEPKEPFAPQTTKSTSELNAMPENINEDAYDHLEIAYYPWNLPFHLWTEEARHYMRHMGVEYFRFKQWFPQDETINVINLHTEYFGLIELERAIITKDNTKINSIIGSTPLLTDYYNVNNTNELKNSLSLLLNRAGISFDELLDLLYTNFIEAEIESISFEDDGCDIDSASITISDNDLDRLHRFKRLLNKTGFSTFELDRLLNAFNFTDINNDTIIKTSLIKQLADETKVDVIKLLSFWNKIDTKAKRNEKSLYEMHFLNKSVQNPLDILLDVFKLNVNGDELENAGLYNMDNHDYFQHIASALRISGKDLNLLIEEVLPDNIINLDNLSELFRHVILADSLKISIDELLIFKDLSGYQAFLSDINDSVKFIEQVNKVKSSPFTIKGLNYLLKNKGKGEGAAILISEDAVFRNLIDLQKTLNDIWMEAKAIQEIENDREVTEFVLKWFLPEEIFSEAMLLIEGFSEKSQNEQHTFLAEYLLEALDQDAFVKLVDNGGTLETDEERFAYTRPLTEAFYLEELIQHVLKENVYVHWSNVLELNEELIRLLLEELLRNPENSENKAIDVFIKTDFIESEPDNVNISTFPFQFDVAVHLNKVNSFINAFGWKEDELNFMFKDDYQPGSWINPNNLLTDQAGTEQDLQNFINLHNAFETETAMRNNAFSIMKLIKIARDEQAIINVKEYILNNSHWNENDLDFLSGQEGFDYTHEDFFNETAMMRLVKVFDMLHKLQIPASRAKVWNIITPTRQVAKQVISAAKNKHSINRWLELAPGIRDKIREKQRDALQALVIKVNESFIKDENDLYNYFLIDTEMSSCMITSRILNATLSIQIFVQRILLNLESDEMTISYSKRKEWEWRKNYRVWEANRKVFLYPENWLEPELRDNKTDLFKRFIEDEVLHQEINEQNVTKAYKQYIKELDKISEPEVVGMCKDELEEIWYVFGRTKSSPHTYYFREWKDDSYWTHWKIIDIPISSDHFIPVMHLGRLFLFWPDIIQKGKAESQGDSNSNQQPISTFLVNLNWSEYRDNAWLEPKKGVNNMEITDNISGSINLDRFKRRLYLRADHNHNGDLMIHVFLFFSPNNPRLFHSFKMEGCSFQPVTVWNYFMVDLKKPNHLDFNKNINNMKIWASFPQPFIHYVRQRDEFIKEDFSQLGIDGEFVEPEKHSKGYILFPNSDYKLLFSHQNPDFKEPEPFFLDGPTYTFFSRVSTKQIHVEEEVTVWKEVALQNTECYEFAYPQGCFSVDALKVASTANLPSYGETTDVYADDSPDVFDDTTITVHVTGHTQGVGEVDKEIHLTKVISEIEIRNIPAISKQYSFYTFFHNYLCDFVTELNRKGIDGLLAPHPNSELFRQQKSFEMFQQRFNPNEDYVIEPYPAVDIDFRTGGGYSIYNWELFYHAPMMIAEHLSANRQFEDAQKWFHYIFNPTSSEGETPERFWNIKPFYEETIKGVNNYLKDLLTHDEEKGEHDELSRQINTWKSNPFSPHAVARLRIVAYMKRTVMSYIENLIAWGDHLFMQNTMESVNEATQIYILASRILGNKPFEISRESSEPKSFNEMEGTFGSFSNALVEIENAVFKKASQNQGNKDTEKGQQELLSIMYFCTPFNENLLQYWDTVDDRLFKIRNCLDIEGTKRDLSLFAPPIDPAAIVAAMAGGGSLANALGNLNAPLPYYKFRYIIQMAKQLCGEVRSLGNSLLQAIEKKDAEVMSLLRAEHDLNVNKAMKLIREETLKETEINIDALNEARKITEHRKEFYSKLITSKLLKKEQKQIDKIKTVNILSTISGSIRASEAIVATTVPDAQGGVAGISSPFLTAKYGGINITTALAALAGASDIWAGIEQSKGQIASIEAGYERREEDWEFQKESADKELQKIDEDLKSAEKRKEIAEKELELQLLQISNSAEISDFLERKFTSEELYTWMKNQLSKVYFQCYEMAHSLATQAERAFRFELADNTARFIDFGYWNSMKKGLLAGEQLYKDIQRMEIAYMEKNKRTYELSKHISLAVLNPQALLNLKETGECYFDIPEIIFDLDHPGQYMRRIKSVTLTIPCVTANFTNITAKLTMLSNRMRINTNDADILDYQEKAENETRFRYNMAGKQSIATSRAENDSGLFEMNFEDERYLPFEGAGAISRWQLLLPEEVRQFDYDSISDVIIGMNYTAKDGGGVFRNNVNNYLKDKIGELLTGQNELPRLFSLKTEFPDEFHQFLNPEGSNDHLTTLQIKKKHFAHFLKKFELKIKELYVVLKLKDGETIGTGEEEPFTMKLGITDYLQDGNLIKSENFGNLYAAGFVNISGEDVVQDWILKADESKLDPEKLDDIILFLKFEANDNA